MGRSAVSRHGDLGPWLGRPSIGAACPPRGGRWASARMRPVGHAGAMHEAGAVGTAIEKVIHELARRRYGRPARAGDPRRHARRGRLGGLLRGRHPGRPRLPHRHVHGHVTTTCTAPCAATLAATPRRPIRSATAVALPCPRCPDRPSSAARWRHVPDGAGARGQRGRQHLPGRARRAHRPGLHDPGAGPRRSATGCSSTAGTVVRRLDPDQAEEMSAALATMFAFADEADVQAREAAGGSSSAGSAPAPSGSRDCRPSPPDSP